VVTPTKMARWGLLWAMARSGGGRVPPALIAAPWDALPNGSEKYFETPPAAITAAGLLGQADAETLAALVDRLGREDDPDWLDGDLAGALTALTGERFGHDPARWRQWWADRRSGAD